MAFEPGIQTIESSFAAIPPELWNRLGTKILPKLRSGSELKVEVGFSVRVRAESAPSLTVELRQILQELGLADSVRVEIS